VLIALRRSHAAPWTPTNAHAKLTLLECAGDLLDASSADEAALYCLELLVDPLAFDQQMRPSFSISHYAHGALRGALPAASNASHERAVDYLLGALPDDDDPATVDNLLRLISQLRSTPVAAQAEQLRAAALNQTSPRLSAALLGALLHDRDEEELLRRAAAGDRDAVAVLGSATSLSTAAASALIERDAAACQQLITDARNGRYAGSDWDSTRALTFANFTFPALAQWEPVVDVVCHPLVAQRDKIRAMHLLAVRADELPDEIAVALQQAVSTERRTSIASGHTSPLDRATEPLLKATFELGLALGILSTTSAVQRILTWLRGSAAQRQAAGNLLDVLGRQAHDPIVQGALITLTGDPQYHVRAAAAAALTRGATQSVPDLVELAVTTAARERGCAVPLAIAHALPHASDAWPRKDIIRALLAEHISAHVRAASDDGASQP
jgi:hypothetical protein